MSGNKWMVLGVVAVMLLVGVAAYFFLGTEPEPPSVSPRSSRSGVGEQKPTAPVVNGAVTPIERSTFDPKAEDEAPSAKVSSEDTGLRLQGVVVDESGTGIPGADVLLIRDVSAIKQRAQDGDTVARVKTSRSGGFAFDELASGDTYIVQASHKDFTTERRHPIDTSDAKTLRPNIVLHAGISLEGRVLDAQGAPLESVEVLVSDMNIQSMDPVSPLERSTKTREDGTYTVEHLAPGMKKILAKRSGFSSDGRQAVDVRPEVNQKGIDFVLTRGLLIRGRVVDQSSKAPVQGAVIMARPTQPLMRSGVVTEPDPSGNLTGDEASRDDGFRKSDVVKAELRRQAESARANTGSPVSSAFNMAQKSFLVETAVTNEQGEFVLDGLMEARYMIQARAVGFLMNQGVPADAGAENCEVTLAKCAVIRGQVIDDETGKPVTRFTLGAHQSPDLQFIPPGFRQRFSDPNGAFAYTDVRPGRYWLVAEAEGYAGGRSADAIQVEPEQEATGVVVRVVRGGTIVGHVRDGEGKPVVNAKVEAEISNQSMGLQDNPFTRVIGQQMRGRTSRSAVTDGSGRYVISMLVDGNFKVKVEHPEFSEAVTAEVTVSGRKEVPAPDVILIPGATIRGVVKKPDGAVDPRATVMISGADAGSFFSRSIPTDSEGRYQLKGLKPGNYKVQVSQRDGVFDLFTLMASQGALVVTVGAGQEKEVNL